MLQQYLDTGQCTNSAAPVPGLETPCKLAAGISEAQLAQHACSNFMASICRNGCVMASLECLHLCKASVPYFMPAASAFGPHSQRRAQWAAC